MQLLNEPSHAVNRLNRVEELKFATLGQEQLIYFKIDQLWAQLQTWT